MKRVIPVLMVLAACGGGPESLTLTPDVRELAADGITVVELEADVVFRGDPIPDGKDVTFTCNQPLLFETRDDVVADVAGGRKTGEQEVETDAQGGVARAYMLAPLSAGTITVEASFTTVNKDVLSDSVTFEVAPPPLIAAGKGDETNFVSHFDFTCDQINVGGFVQNRDPIEVSCHVTLKDVTGRELPHTPVMFFAEAGHIRDEPATDRQPRTITYVIPTAPPQLPRDVEPWPAESEASLNLVEFTSDPNYVQYNPTDGLVTLLAVVRGQESFDDRNGNGEIDSDESWIDEGEPFLDIDDDGEFTQDTDPEACCDSNGNGTVDGLNGQWDSDIWIGRMFHILWTGTADPDASFIVPAEPWSIAAQDNETFKLRIVDRNRNPLATNDADDNLELDESSNLVLAPMSLANGITLEPTTGLYLNNVFPVFRFGTGGATTNPIFAGLRMAGTTDRLEGREWEFTLTDDRSTSNMCDQDVDNGSVTATLEYTIARDVSSRDAIVSSSGTLTDLPSSDALCQ